MNRRRWMGLIATGLAVGVLRLLFEGHWFSYMERLGDSSLFWVWAGPTLAGTAAALWFPLLKETQRTTLKIIGCSILGVALSELVLAGAELSQIIGKTGITPNGEPYSLYQYTATHAVPLVAIMISVWGGVLGGALTLLVHIVRIGIKKLAINRLASAR